MTTSSRSKYLEVIFCTQTFTNQGRPDTEKPHYSKQPQKMSDHTMDMEFDTIQPAASPGKRASSETNGSPPKKRKDDLRPKVVMAAAVTKAYHESTKAMNNDLIIDRIFSTLSTCKDAMEFCKQVTSGMSPAERDKVVFALDILSGLIIRMSHGEVLPVSPEVVNRDINREQVQNLTPEETKALLLSLAPAELAKLLKK